MMEVSHSLRKKLFISPGRQQPAQSPLGFLVGTQVETALKMTLKAWLFLSRWQKIPMGEKLGYMEVLQGLFSNKGKHHLDSVQ